MSNATVFYGLHKSFVCTRLSLLLLSCQRTMSPYRILKTTLSPARTKSTQHYLVLRLLAISTFSLSCEIRILASQVTLSKKESQAPMFIQIFLFANISFFFSTYVGTDISGRMLTIRSQSLRMLIAFEQALQVWKKAPTTVLQKTRSMIL